MSLIETIALSFLSRAFYDSARITLQKASSRSRKPLPTREQRAEALLILAGLQTSYAEFQTTCRSLLSCLVADLMRDDVAAAVRAWLALPRETQTSELQKFSDEAKRRLEAAAARDDWADYEGRRHLKCFALRYMTVETLQNEADFTVEFLTAPGWRSEGHFECATTAHYERAASTLARIGTQMKRLKAEHTWAAALLLRELPTLANISVQSDIPIGEFLSDVRAREGHQLAPDILDTQILSARRTALLTFITCTRFAAGRSDFYAKNAGSDPVRACLSLERAMALSVVLTSAIGNALRAAKTEADVAIPSASRALASDLLQLSGTHDQLSKQWLRALLANLHQDNQLETEIGLFRRIELAIQDANATLGKHPEDLGFDEMVTRLLGHRKAIRKALEAASELEERLPHLDSSDTREELSRKDLIVALRERLAKMLSELPAAPETQSTVAPNTTIQNVIVSLRPTQRTSSCIKAYLSAHRILTEASH